MSTQILLIDLSSIAHPLWHTSASEPDPNATSTKVVERVRALASGQPHVAVCCDSGRSFRKDISDDYKANRPISDASLQHQIMLAMETLRGDGFPVWAVKGFEADDLIATGARLALSLEHQEQYPASLAPCAVTIASSDKDLCALVNDRVHVKSLTNGNLYDTDGVLAKFGVRPDQMVDYLALVGDASDNIKGATGIGPKGAAKLLNKYGTLEDLYADLDAHGTNFTPALATSLREFHDRMIVTRSLITLRTDAPVPFEEIFRERVPADTAVFGEEPMEEDQALTAASGGDMVGHSDGAAPSKPSGPNGGDSATHQTPVVAQTVPDAGASAAAAREDRRPSVPNGGDSGGSPIGPLAHGPIVHVPTVLHAPAEFERQLEPRSYAEAKALATDMFAARLFNAYGNAPAVLATMLAGREFGLPTAASLRAFDIIEGKQSMKADFLRAIVLKSGLAEYFRCTERTPDRATFITKRKGEPEMALSFTLDEAKAAYSKRLKDGTVDLVSFNASGYGKNPADMLVARAGAKLARLVYPDVTHGLYCREEMEQ